MERTRGKIDHHTRRLGKAGRAGAAGIAFALLAGSVEAGLVTLNADASLIGSSSDASNFRYRVSNTNWDQIIASSTSISNSTIVGSRNPGTHSALKNAAWDFTVSFVPLSGYIFALDPVAGLNSNAAQSITWTSLFGGVDPLRAHNAIKLTVSAGSGMPGGIDTAYVDVSNLAFSTSGFLSTGSLASMRNNWDDFGSLTDRDDPDTLTQWILADENLANWAWALTGRVQAGFTYLPGVSSPGGNLDERLKFDILPQWVTAVPSPGGFAFLALGGFVVLRRVRGG